MVIETEPIKCPFCSYDQFINIISRDDDLKIVRCRGCDLAYVNPRPSLDIISKIYSSNYYNGETNKKIGYDLYRPSVMTIKSSKPFCFNYLEEEIDFSGKRVLDIGCAFGSLIYWMEKAGARGTGIDLSPDGIKWGEKKLNLDLRQNSLEELNEPCNSFDLITMVDLIEHVVDLQSFMDKVNYLLKPGGMVFVQTPNFGCYPKWKDKCCFLRISLEHLLYFEPVTLDALFASQNMFPKRKTISIRTIPGNIDEYISNNVKSQSFLRRLACSLPYIDYVRYLRLKLRNNRNLYNLDETSKDGTAIFAIYQKQ